MSTRRENGSAGFLRYHSHMRKAMLLIAFAGAAMASAEDSPLVALAKRTNRKAAKAPVITNETLARGKGRVSLPEGEPAPLPSIATTSASAVATAAATTPQPVQQPERPRVAPPAAPVTPAQNAPASTVRNIEPQSSARFITPAASTVRTVQPSAAAPVNPQSTAGRIDPQSTVRNIDPQQSNRPPQ